MPDLAARIAALPMEVPATVQVAFCYGRERIEECPRDCPHYPDGDHACDFDPAENVKVAIAELVGVIEGLVKERCETCGNTEDERGHYCLLLGIATRDDFYCRLWEPTP